MTVINIQGRSLQSYPILLSKMYAQGKPRNSLVTHTCRCWYAEARGNLFEGLRVITDISGWRKGILRLQILMFPWSNIIQFNYLNQLPV